jgi:hypothetical protein
MAIIHERSIIKEVETSRFPDGALFVTQGWEFETPIIARVVNSLGQPETKTIIATPNDPETAANLRAAGINVEAEYERRTLLLLDPTARTIRTFDGRAIPEIRMEDFGAPQAVGRGETAEIPANWGQQAPPAILRGSPANIPAPTQESATDSFTAGLQAGSAMGSQAALVQQQQLAQQAAQQQQIGAAPDGFPTFPSALPQAKPTPNWAKGMAAQVPVANPNGAPFVIDQSGGENAANG